MDSIRKIENKNALQIVWKGNKGLYYKNLGEHEGLHQQEQNRIFTKSQKRKKKKRNQKKKAYHDDEMLQIRKINRRIRFDSDPRPMQQKLAIWKHNEGSERRRKEVNVQQRPPHGGRRR